MKKLPLPVLCLILAFILSACGTDLTPAHEIISSGKRLLTPQEFELMFADADRYKNYKVDFYGKVCMVTRDMYANYVQAYADPKNNQKTVLLLITDNNVNVKKDDYIHVVGFVRGHYEGTNGFGIRLSCPNIIATSVEKTDYITAVSPAIKTVLIDQEQNREGYVLMIKKLELAEGESRLYVKITNKSREKISFYSYNTKLVQGNRQYKRQLNHQANYPQPQNNISPGAETEGIIPFPPLDSSQKLKIIARGTSGKKNREVGPFIFEVAI